MAIIDVSFEGVLSVATSIESTLAEVEPEFNRLKNRISDLDSVWSSTKADAFKHDLDALSTSLDNFSKKNTAFVSFLNEAVTAYRADVDSLTNAINSISISSGGSN